MDGFPEVKLWVCLIHANAWLHIKGSNEMFEFVPHRDPSVSIYRSVDEVWYKRAVEQHYVEAQSFVYSVPFNEGLSQIYSAWI